MKAVNIPTTFQEWIEQNQESMPDAARAARLVQQMLHASILCTKELFYQPSDAMVIEVLRQMVDSFYRFKLDLVEDVEDEVPVVLM